jgi:trans-aconitate 2-methyltransferase
VASHGGTCRTWELDSMSTWIRHTPLPCRAMREWNAAVYHKVSNPQLDWGLPVLERLPLHGDEMVLDVGCGTGRLTEKLAQRLPRGQVVAIDQSENMLRTARQYLATNVNRRVAFARADAAALPFAGIADAIFSTATFHWVLHHERLFASLFRALKPGGRLVAQCGGGPNLERLHDRCLRLMREPLFAPHFSRWRDPWEFADAATTAQRLENAGFTDIETSVHASPVLQPDAPSYGEFVAHVICRPHLEHLSDPSLRARFMERLTEPAAKDSPPFELDYWRLNIDARRPAH